MSYNFRLNQTSKTQKGEGGYVPDFSWGNDLSCDIFRQIDRIDFF